MIAPYPEIKLSGDKLIMIATALRQMLDEYSYNRCDIEACGCSSSIKIAYAEKILKELDAMITEAEKCQQI